jgi:two-component system OmpR family sensor kinase
MGRLVDDLLLLARLDSGGELERQEVDLSRQAIEAIDDARVVGTDHRWSLDLPPEPVLVLGDAHRLHQVITNLLNNARSHTPAGTRVELSLAVRAGRAVLVVADNGPGIPAHLVPKVQQRFVRGDAARSHKAGNTGLGLAIVTGVIAAHGGTVHIDSSSTGTTVTVELPMDQAEVTEPTDAC